jgi:outer membrane protein insertion porin family/translocation and assembly module TamA
MIVPSRPSRPFRAGTSLAAAGCVACCCACASIPAGRSAIDSVTVVGARDVDVAELESKLATAESPRFLGLFRGVVFDYSIFDAAVLQRDLARVEHYYRTHGFLEAHARAARVVHKSGDHVRVEVVVDEGPPTLNRTVTVNGLEDLPPEVADAARAAVAAALPAGARFDEDAYKKAQTAAVRALTDRGYAYAKEQADAQADLASHSIDYTFALTPGPTAVFGDITIVGLDPDAAGPAKQELDEAPLRRAMNLHPGHPFSTSAIDAATQALLDLEVMSAAQIVPQLADPPASVVPLVVKVEPAKLREIRLGGGFELDQIKTDVHGLIGWEDHNFLGGLRDFSVDFKPGVVLYPTRIDNIVSPDHLLPWERLRLQLRIPGILEPRTTLLLRPELNVFPLLVKPNPDPLEPVVGYVEPKGTVGLERRFGKYFVVTLAHNVQGEIPFPYVLQPDEALPNVLLSFPQLVTTLDLRDDPVHTHKGLYLSNDLQVAAGILGSSASDVRIAPEVRGYVPITHSITFAARAQFGFLFAQDYGDYVRHHLGEMRTPQQQIGDNKDIQIVFFRGFFSGGPSSNRGYPLRGIAPHGAVPFLNPTNVQQFLNCKVNQSEQACSVPIGGFTQWEASAEVRFAVSGPLGAAVFCDAGDVAAEELTLRWTFLHMSCGGGLRYDTPVGPIRLDVGYRIPFLQVLGYSNESDAQKNNPGEGQQPRIFGQPLGLSFGVLESF